MYHQQHLLKKIILRKNKGIVMTIDGEACYPSPRDTFPLASLTWWNVIQPMRTRPRNASNYYSMRSLLAALANPTPVFRLVLYYVVSET